MWKGSIWSCVKNCSSKKLHKWHCTFSGSWRYTRQVSGRLDEWLSRKVKYRQTDRQTKIPPFTLEYVFSSAALEATHPSSQTIFRGLPANEKHYICRLFLASSSSSFFPFLLPLLLLLPLLKSLFLYMIAFTTCHHQLLVLSTNTKESFHRHSHSLISHTSHTFKTLWTEEKKKNTSRLTVSTGLLLFHGRYEADCEINHSVIVFWTVKKSVSVSLLAKNEEIIVLQKVTAVEPEKNEWESFFRKLMFQLSMEAEDPGEESTVGNREFPSVSDLSVCLCPFVCLSLSDTLHPTNRVKWRDGGRQWEG